MTKISYEEMKQILRIQKYKEIANYDKVVETGVNTIWQNMCAELNDPNVDPTEIFDSELESLKNAKYAMQLMNMCCLSETWEQDLYNFLKEKGLIEILSNDYKFTQRAFDQTYPTCQISNYSLILEMRALVNAIKHGEGRALQNIRRMTSDTILADSNIGEIDENGLTIRKKEIDFDNSTLTSRTLNVDGKLQQYSEAIIDFWEDVYNIDRTNHETHEM